MPFNDGQEGYATPRSAGITSGSLVFWLGCKGGQRHSAEQITRGAFDNPHFAVSYFNSTTTDVLSLANAVKIPRPFFTFVFGSLRLRESCCREA